MRVAAVVVTFNRRDLLQESLTAIHAQTRRPDLVVVVDNASTDGTSPVVADAWPDVRLLTLTHNTGGAGGFTVGIREALAQGCDLVWLMDDDTVPQPDALAELLAARDGYRPGPPPALVASRVVWVDGRDHPMNTPRRRPMVRGEQTRSAEAVGCVPVRSASFVSILIDGERTERLGLPVADFFLWNDDFEFTARLLRHDVGLWCPASVVEHRTKTFGSTDVDPGERFYFEVRNKIWTLSKPGVLSPAERALYSGATLRRWARTFRHSSNRAVLRSAGRRGLRDGVRTRPRPNDEVLTGVGLEP